MTSSLSALVHPGRLTSRKHIIWALFPLASSYALPLGGSARDGRTEQRGDRVLTYPILPSHLCLSPPPTSSSAPPCHREASAKASLPPAAAAATVYCLPTPQHGGPFWTLLVPCTMPPLGVLSPSHPSVNGLFY